MTRSLLNREIKFRSCSAEVRLVTSWATASSRKAMSCSFHAFQKFLGVPVMAYFTPFLLDAITIWANLQRCRIHLLPFLAANVLFYRLFYANLGSFVLRHDIRPSIVELVPTIYCKFPGNMEQVVFRMLPADIFQVEAESFTLTYSFWIALAQQQGVIDFSLEWTRPSVRGSSSSSLVRSTLTAKYSFSAPARHSG